MARIACVDVGEVNGHPFFNVASIGFGVDLTRALTRYLFNSGGAALVDAGAAGEARALRCSGWRSAIACHWGRIRQSDG